MDKQYLQEKLAGMRDKYVGSTREGNLAVEMHEMADRKAQKIKKKLVSLEMERCHKQIEQKDCSKLDEKILKHKSLLAQCRKRG